jgi:glycosyltransferase involved in cell wall biosynthesis
MRVLQIGADRSKRGILYPGSPASDRQKAYGELFGDLDIIGFSRTSDHAAPHAISDHVRLHPTNSFSSFFYGLDAIRIARRLPRPDVASAQDPFETGLVGWLIAWMRKVPLHVQVHTDFLSPEYARHSMRNRLRVSIAKFVLRRAAGVRVVSARIKRDIESRRFAQAPISVLPIFVDVEHFHWALPNPALAERFVRFSSKILVVSRLEPEKDVELAIRTFTGSAHENACLIVVGEGSLREDLEYLSSTLEPERRVFFEGEQDPTPYYKLADLVLCTSRYDGYGLVIVEALASGKPVLSTDVGIAREAGAIVASPDKLIEKLTEWFQHGPREAHLKNYPYKNFDGYIREYCEDIKACVRR